MKCRKCNSVLDAYDQRNVLPTLLGLCCDCFRGAMVSRGRKRRVAKKQLARSLRTERIHWKRLRGSHDVAIRMVKVSLTTAPFGDWMECVASGHVAPSADLKTILIGGKDGP